MSQYLNKEQAFSIKEKHGTGIYLFHEHLFDANIDDIKKNFLSITPSFDLSFSIKANYYSQIIKKAQLKDLNFDCASLMEIDKLQELAIPAEKIWLNSPYLPHDLLNICLTAGIKIYADSIEQVKIIGEQASALKVEANIGIRLNFPHLNASRFGIEATKENVTLLHNLLNSTRYLRLTALHTHFSGAVRDASSLAQRAEALYKLYKESFPAFPIQQLNLGGGLSGPMPPQLSDQFNYKIPDWRSYAAAVSKAMPEFSSHGVKFALEPGMALVANTFSFISEIIQVKKISNRNIALLNTSTIFLKPTNHKKSIIFDVYHQEKSNGEKHEYQLAGMTCMENDILGTYTGQLQKGDLVVFHNVGAYTFSYRPDFIFNQPEVVTI